MQIEFLAIAATFHASGAPGVRMVSTAFGAPAVSREVVEAKSVVEAETAFGRFVEAAKMKGKSFSARARKIGDGRAVAGWNKIRLAHDYEAAEFNFGAWVDEQAANIAAEIRKAGQRGMASDLAAWVVPSSRMPAGQPGYLAIGFTAPFMGADIVRLGPHGTTLARCPYPDIRSLLWAAAQSYPILPIPAEPVAA